METKKVRIAINGLGRIGRQALKACLGISNDMRMQLSPLINIDEIELVAVNDLADIRVLAHLIKYDTVYGRYEKEITVKLNGEVIDWEGHTATEDHQADLSEGEVLLVIGGKELRVFNEKDPTQLPWKELEVDVVIESTGVFESYQSARFHIDAGAKRVVISSPAKGVEGKEGHTLVYGAELTTQEIGKMEIVSNASCTTNCITPVIQLLESEFGVEKAMMTTVHAYTATQAIVDAPDKKDIRRGRAGGMNIIPSTTGAAKATGYVIPSLKETFDGIAIRVPVINGSISDITAVLKRNTTEKELTDIFLQAAESPLYKYILQPSNEPLVSTDIIGNPASAIIDLGFIRVVGGNMVKILVWYDNEWGYTNRLVEMAVDVGKKISA